MNVSAVVLPPELAQHIRETEHGCWLWLGSQTPKGYGILPAPFGRVLAHRWAHETFVAPIPDGYHVDHLCFVRSCCNPAHLEAVTPSENVRRAAGTETCRRGHIRAEVGYYHFRNGTRHCRACLNEKQARYVARKATT